MSKFFDVTELDKIHRGSVVEGMEGNSPSGSTSGPSTPPSGGSRTVLSRSGSATSMSPSTPPWCRVGASLYQDPAPPLPTPQQIEDSIKLLNQTSSVTKTEDTKCKTNSDKKDTNKADKTQDKTANENIIWDTNKSERTKEPVDKNKHKTPKDTNSGDTVQTDYQYSFS